MATPTYAQVITQINTFIVTNHNNEITAAVLNPILILLTDFTNNTIGDLSTLTTDENDTIVAAINSLKDNINNITNNGVQLYTGMGDPNVTPPPTYKPADFYLQVDSFDLPVQLWQFNGFIWTNGTVVQWGSITGDINDQTDLINILNDKAEQADLDAHIADLLNPHQTTASQVPTIPNAVYLLGNNVQLNLDETESSLIAGFKISKINIKDLYQTGIVRPDVDVTVLTITPADTLTITQCDRILFVNEVFPDTPANLIADFIHDFGDKVFVANDINTPLTAGTRGIYYVGLDKLGSQVYRPAKIYDLDIAYMARLLIENAAGVYTIISAKYFPDIAYNNPVEKDRKVAASGYIVPSGAPSISFGNRGVSFSKNSINYSNNKFDPNYLTVADTVNPTPMQFLYALPNISSLAVNIALSTTINPTQYYLASGAVGAGSVANTSYQVYRLLVTVTGTMVIQTKASTVNTPQFGVNAIFSNRDDALAGLNSVVFPDMLPVGDAIVLGKFLLRAGTNPNGSQLIDPNDFYFQPTTSTSSTSTVGVTVHDLLSGKNDNPAFQHVTTDDITNWNGLSSTIDLQTAYDNGQLINTTLGALILKQDSGADTDNILVGKNAADVNTFELKGNGAIKSFDYISVESNVLFAPGRTIGVKIETDSGDYPVVDFRRWDGTGFNHYVAKIALTNDVFWGLRFNTGLNNTNTDASITKMILSLQTGNLLLQNGGTFTDNGIDRLQVSGSALVDGLRYTKGINIINKDLNTLLIAGFYIGFGLTNAPLSSAEYFYIYVEVHDVNTDWVHQTATTFGNIETGNRIFSRVKVNGAWGAWAEIITGTGTAGQVSFWNGTGTQTGDNELIWDNVNKRLGIGGTPSGTYDLQVFGGASFTFPILVSHDGGRSEITSELKVGSLFCASLNSVDGNDLSISAADLIGSSANISFFTASASEANVKRMTIAGLSGNVGVGTDAPTEILHVVGNGLFTGTVQGANATAANHFVTKGQLEANQIEVSGNQTALAAWNGKEVTFMANGLLTIPNTLTDQYSFDVAADVGTTVTWAITAPYTWRVAGLAVGVPPPAMTEWQFCTVSKRIGTNEIRVRGL